MNDTIFYFFYGLAHQSTLVDNIIIFFAQYFPYVVLMLAGLFLIFHHEIVQAENPYRLFMEKKVEIAKVFLAGVSAWILAQVLKVAIHMPRPFISLTGVKSVISETGYAFPSGHATFYMALAFSIFFLHRKAGYWFIAFALIIGIARITAGVHFPVDILGGFILGAFIAWVFRNIYKTSDKGITIQ